MSQTLSEERARREYEAIKAFYVHVLVFVPVFLLFVASDIVGGGRAWTPWLGALWGLAVVLHGYDAFVQMPRRMAKWELEQIEAMKSHG